MRAGFHVCVTAWLLIAFAQAPLQHAHRSDPAHEHSRGAFAHLHLPSQQSDSPSWRTADPDEDARLVEWVSDAASGGVRLLATISERVSQPALAAYGRVRLDFETPTHDPPWSAQTPSRAPPA